MILQMRTLRFQDINRSVQGHKVSWTSGLILSPILMCFRSLGATVGASRFLPAMPEVESGQRVQIPALPLTSQGHLGIDLL